LTNITKLYYYYLKKELYNLESYKTLGIERNASESEIKRAYKQLAKKYHPDLNKSPNSKEEFIKIQKAYEEIINPKIEMDSLFGFVFERWDKLIKEDDFNDKKFTIYDKFGDTEKSKDYKKYKWTLNKVKLLNMLYRKLQSEYIVEKINDIIGIEIIINHLQKVLNDEINIKEKITKPDDMNIKNIEYIKHPFYKFDHTLPEYIQKHYEIDIIHIKKLVFDIQNQFHPKFINKLPMRIQIFLRNIMRLLIEKLNDL
jgi:hypothetical protein